MHLVRGRRGEGHLNRAVVRQVQPLLIGGDHLRQVAGGRGFRRGRLRSRVRFNSVRTGFRGLVLTVPVHSSPLSADPPRLGEAQLDRPFHLTVWTGGTEPIPAQAGDGGAAEGLQVRLDVLQLRLSVSPAVAGIRGREVVCQLLPVLAARHHGEHGHPFRLGEGGGIGEEVLHLGAAGDDLPDVRKATLPGRSAVLPLAAFLFRREDQRLRPVRPVGYRHLFRVGGQFKVVFPPGPRTGEDHQTTFSADVHSRP